MKPSEGYGVQARCSAVDREEGPDLSVTVNGLKLPNPFLIGSGPPGTNYTVMKRAFDEGWGGVIAKTVRFWKNPFEKFLCQTWSSCVSVSVSNGLKNHLKICSRTRALSLGFSIKLLCNRFAGVSWEFSIKLFLQLLAKVWADDISVVCKFQRDWNSGFSTSQCFKNLHVRRRRKLIIIQ